MENKDVISKRKANRVMLLLAVIFLASAVGLGGIYAWKSIKNTRSENSDDITHQSANAEAVLDKNGMPEDGSDITETKIARDVTSLRELLLEDGKFAIELSEDIRITKGFNVNGTKKLVGDKTITMELYAEPFQSILKVQAGATLILDGITLDGNSNATGVEVEKKAGFTSLSGKILYPASYGVLSQGTTWIKDITIDRGVDSGLCVMTDSKAYVEGGEISGCSKAAIHVVIGGYVSISGDTKLTDSYMCVNNRGTCEITDGVISDAWRTLIWNLGELTVDYEGKDKDDKLEWYNAGEFGIRSGENTKTYINGLYLHDIAKGGIKGIKHESMVVTNCKVENVGTYGVESANGKQDVFFTDIEVINAKNSGVRVYGANKIEVTNVTVTDTEGRGIQNGNATVIAKNVKIINSKLSGIYGGKDSTTEVEDAEILSSKRYGVENYAGTMTVKNVKITDAALSGVVSKEGTVTNLSNVTITKPVMRGIMNLGGTVTADTITIESPGQYGVTSTLTGEHAGELTVSNLTVKNVLTNNALNCHASVVTAKNVNISGAAGYGVRVTGGGTMTLTDINIKDCGTRGMGSSNDNSVLNVTNAEVDSTGMSGVVVGAGAIANLENITLKNSGMTSGDKKQYTASYRSALATSDGTINAKNVTIDDAVGSGVYVNGGTLNAETVVINRAAENGLFFTSSPTNGEAVVKMAGVTINAPKNRGIYNDGGTVELSDVKITNPENYGVTTALLEKTKYAGSIAIKGLEITGVKKSNALNCNASEMTIIDATISDVAKYGAYVLNGGKMTINDIKLKDCGTRGISSTNDNSILNVTNAEIDSTGMSGIVVGSGATANLENITLKNSGLTSGKDTTYTASYRSALATSDGTINAKNVTIDDAVGSGVYVNGGTLTAENVVVNRAGENGAFFTSSKTNGEAVVKMNGVNIQAPKNRGVYNDGGTVELSDVKITNPEDYGVTTALLENTKYSGSVTIKGLNISGVKKSNALNCNASEMTIVDGTISDVAKYGAYVLNGGKMTITDINIKDCGTRGMCSTGNDSILSITNAEIENTGMSGIVVGSGAVANLENITLKNSGLTSGKDTTYTASYRSALSTSDGTINAKNVTIDDAVGNGVYVNGGTLTAENVVVNRAGENGAFFTSSGTNGEAVVKMNGVDIQTPKNRGVYNDGGTVELSNVKITDPATYGVTTALLTNTEYVGSLTVTGLNISGVKKNNALNCNASEMTIVDGTISDVAGHGAYVLNGGKLTLNDVELSRIAERGVWSEAATAALKNVEVHDAQYGVFVDGGTTTFDGGKVTEVSTQGIYITSANKGLATADIKAVTIHEAGKRGVYNYGGHVTLTGVTITDPGEYGVSSGKADWTVGEETTTFVGKVTATDLTVTGVKKNNALHCNASEMSVDGGIISDVAEHGAYVVSSGKLTLKDVEIHKTGIDGICIESTETGKATANIEAVTIYDVVQRGVRNEGGDVILTVVTITDPGTYGISSSKGDWKEDNTTYVGKVTASDLTVTGVKMNNALNCNNSEIEVTGGTLSNIKEYAARVVANGKLTLNNMTIAQCGKDAIGVQKGTATMIGGTITGTAGYDVNLENTTGTASVTLTGVSITRAEGNTHGSMIVAHGQDKDGKDYGGATTLTLDNCSLTGSGSPTTQSAIVVTKGTLNIQNGGTYTNNVSGVSGGVISIASTGNVNINQGETKNTVSFIGNGCDSTANAASGGVINVQDGGTLKADTCAFTNNYLKCTGSSVCTGGAISVGSKTNGDVVIKNATFDGNRIEAMNAYGGAISVAGSCYLTMENCVFGESSPNTAATGGNDVRGANNTVFNLSGKIVAEFYNTTNLHTLHVTGALHSESAIIMRWKDISAVAEKIVITFANAGLVSANKDYFALHADNAEDYYLVYSASNKLAKVRLK